MPISTTLSRSYHRIRRERNAVNRVDELVGHTPVIELRRSGDGFAFLKHEGIGPGGSFFDRVARVQLDRRSDLDTVYTAGLTAHTVSLAMGAAERGVRLNVFTSPDDSRRLQALIKSFGVTFERCVSDDEVAERLDRLGEPRAVVRRDDEDAVIGAHREIAAELAVTDLDVQHLVVIDYGVEEERLLAAYRYAGLDPKIRFVHDDAERPRSLDGRASARRTQVAHREGLLLGPSAAEVADRTIDVAINYQAPTVGILPDGGHRYLGWW